MCGGRPRFRVSQNREKNNLLKSQTQPNPRKQNFNFGLFRYSALLFGPRNAANDHLGLFRELVRKLFLDNPPNALTMASASLRGKPSLETRLDKYVGHTSRSPGRTKSFGRPPSPRPSLLMAAGSSPGARASPRIEGIKLTQAQPFSPGQLTPSPGGSSRLGKGGFSARTPRSPGATAREEASPHNLSVSFSRIEILQQPAKHEPHPLRSALKKGSSAPPSPVVSACSPPASGRPVTPLTAKPQQQSVRAATLGQSENELAMIAAIWAVRNVTSGGRIDESKEDVDAYERGKLPGSLGIERTKALKTTPATIANQTARLAYGDRRVWAGHRLNETAGGDSKRAGAVGSTSKPASPVSPSRSPSSPSTAWQWSPAVSPEGWTYPEPRPGVSTRALPSTAATSGSSSVSRSPTLSNRPPLHAEAPSSASASGRKRPIFTRNVIHPEGDGEGPMRTTATRPPAFGGRRASAPPFDAGGRASAGEGRTAEEGATVQTRSGSESDRRGSIYTHSAGTSLYEDDSLPALNADAVALALAESAVGLKESIDDEATKQQQHQKIE
jgi:hypothetical protein